jgi:hypothetical protein
MVAVPTCDFSQYTCRLFTATPYNPNITNPQTLEHTQVSVLEQHENPAYLGLVERGVELIKVIAEANPPPFSPALMATAFPALLKMMLTSVDQEALQVGSECIRVFVSNATEQVLAWTDGTVNGLDYLMQVIVRLLHPETPESASVYAGILVTRVLMKAGGHVHAHVPDILKAVLGKLNAVKTMTNIQGLIMVFAQLIITDMPSVMAFLTAQGALGGVFTLWAEHQETFFGKYVINVTTAALARVFASRDAALAAVVVQGDEIEVAGRGGVRTRAKTKAAPTQYQQIPLLAKIGKLLIKQYGQELYDDKEEADEAQARASGGGAADDGDSDGEWADEGEEDELAGIAKKSPFAPAEDYAFDISDAIDLGTGFWDEEDEDVRLALFLFVRSCAVVLGWFGCPADITGIRSDAAPLANDKLLHICCCNKSTLSPPPPSTSRSYGLIAIRSCVLCRHAPIL